jgi:hypothetical protein
VMVATNGTTNGVYHEEDARLDSLYSWFPPQPPAAPPLPEAALSLTLKGTLQGIEAMLTIRGQTPAEFQAHLEAVRGLLDPPQAPTQAASPAPEAGGLPQCPYGHGFLRKSTKHDGYFCPRKHEDGSYCRGR